MEKRSPRGNRFGRSPRATLLAVAAALLRAVLGLLDDRAGQLADAAGRLPGEPG